MIVSLMCFSHQSIHSSQNCFSVPCNGHVLPKDQQHGPYRLLGRQEEELVVEWLLENPGIYLDELQLKLQQFMGIFIILTTIFKTIRRLGR